MILANSIRAVVPAPLRPWARKARLFWWRLHGHPTVPGETAKARQRRETEGFFERWCQGQGLDVGYGGDKLCPNCDGWDFEHGDAQTLPGVRADAYDFVYSSHLLEHLDDPKAALQRWWQVLRPGGYLLLFVPHRDLYEKRRELPSRWNPDHRHFFLPEQDDPPHTLGLAALLRASAPDYELIELRTCNAGHTVHAPERHSDGEYSIELIARKPQR